MTTLESDTNKAGINAIARAHAVMDLVPKLLEQVKRHIQCPSWQMGATVAEIERHLEHANADLAALETLQLAMIARATT